MIPLRFVASFVLIAFARLAAAQTVAADSLPPGTLLRVVLRAADTSGAQPTETSIARLGHGDSHGVVRARFDSWDGTTLHVTDARSGISWSFPGGEVASADARTGRDRSRSALVRGALVGAVVGAIGVYYYNAYQDRRWDKFAFGTYSTQMAHGAMLGFAVGAAYRYARPAGIWRHVSLQRPAP